MRLVRSAWYVAIILLATVVSCKSSGEQIIDPPIIQDTINVSVTVPTDMCEGDEVQWEASWEGGSAPYTISWDFGGGAQNASLEGAQSPDAREVQMASHGAVDPVTYTCTVTVTDADGLVGTSEPQTFLIWPLPVAEPPEEPPANKDPSIDDVNYDGSVLEVTVSDGDGDPVTITIIAEEGIIVSPPTRVVQDGNGTATFIISGENIFEVTSGKIKIKVEDGEGGGAESEEMIVAPPSYDLMPGVLYAIPDKWVVAVGEPVTIEVITGRIENFQYLNEVTLTIESDGEMVPDSLNAGAIGGAKSELDGVWRTMYPPTALVGNPNPLIVPQDVLIAIVDIGYNRQRIAINLTPIDGKDITAEGALFNLQFTYSEPGVKKLGIMGLDIVERTCYSNGACEVLLWDSFMANYRGNLNKNIIGLRNEITVE